MHKPHLHYQMTPSSCVSACLKMILDFYGVEKTEFQIRELCEDDGTGVEPQKAVKAVLDLGFNCYKPDNLTFEELEEYISDNLFPIVYLRFNPKAKYSHAVVVYKTAKGKIFFLDPERGERDLDTNQFTKIWSQKITIIIEKPQ